MPRDGRSPPTALSERILQATRSADFDALVRWAAGASPAEVAALAPHVLEVGAGGDTLAKGIADYAARELSQLAICLLPRMELTPPVPVAITGGLLNGHCRCAGRCLPSSARSPRSNLPKRRWTRLPAPCDWRNQSSFSSPGDCPGKSPAHPAVPDPVEEVDHQAQQRARCRTGSR